MQIDDSRPTSKRLQFGAPLEKDALNEAREQAENAAILNPNLSIRDLAGLLAENTPPEILVALAPMLLGRMYATLIRAARAHSKSKQDHLPGFENLPSRIPGPKGKIDIMDANYTAMRAYYWSLTREWTAKQERDPRVIQARALMERLGKYTADEERITVGQVLRLEGIDRL